MNNSTLNTVHVTTSESAERVVMCTVMSVQRPTSACQLEIHAVLFLGDVHITIANRHGLCNGPVFPVVAVGDEREADSGAGACGGGTDGAACAGIKALDHHHDGGAAGIAPLTTHGFE